jgi:hypothetical protein
MDKGGTLYQYTVDNDFPNDITVLKTHSEIQTAEFKKAGTESGIYNHRNVFIELTKAPKLAFSCSNGVTKQIVPFSVFAAGATEDVSLNFLATKGPLKTGYYIGKNRVLFNTIDVINYKKQEQIVYTSTEIEYLPGKPDGYIDTTQQLVDPGICGGPSGTGIHVAPGTKKFSINSTNIIMDRSGYIVNARGHLHGGGVNALLKINDKIVSVPSFVPSLLQLTIIRCVTPRLFTAEKDTPNRSRRKSLGDD